VAFFVSFAAMRRWLMLPLIAACSAPHGAADEQAIRQAMVEQEAAWDRGDIDAFMAAYSDTVCFRSPKRLTCGRDRVTSDHRRAYPDKASMGDLGFGIAEVVPAGGHHAWVTGTWTLHREADTLRGGFALLWVRTAQGWRIARDFTY
jgi:ketosteroid isomerase-like protein